MRDPTEQLLAALLAVAPGDPAGLVRRAAQVTDWPALVARAGRHGVDGFLHHELAGAGAPLPAALGDLAERRRIAALAQRGLHEQLAEAAGALAAAGVAVVALKGIVLAERFYPAPELRPTTDLDLLVGAGDLDRALAALAPLGYEPPAGPTARYLRAHHHQLELTRPRTATLDLHFRLHSDFGQLLPAAGFVARALPYTTRRGAALRVLCPDDELLFLAVHASCHGLARLGWLVDQRLLLRARPELDWAAVAARAAELRVEVALAFCAAALRDELGVAVPAAITALAPRRRRVAARLRGAAAADTGGARAVLGHLLYAAALCDRRSDAAALIGHRLGLLARRRAHLYWPGLVPAAWSV